jgi:hypothetical protein
LERFGQNYSRTELKHPVSGKNYLPSELKKLKYPVFIKKTNKNNIIEMLDKMGSGSESTNAGLFPLETKKIKTLRARKKLLPIGTKEIKTSSIYKKSK